MRDRHSRGRSAVRACLAIMLFLAEYSVNGLAPSDLRPRPPRRACFHGHSRHYLGTFTLQRTFERRAKTRLCERISSVVPGRREKGICSGNDSRILYASLSPPEPCQAKTSTICFLKSTFWAIVLSAPLPKCLAASSCDVTTMGLFQAEFLKTLFSGVTLISTIGSCPKQQLAEKHRANRLNSERGMVRLLRSQADTSTRHR